MLAEFRLRLPVRHPLKVEAVAAETKILTRLKGQLQRAGAAHHAQIPVEKINMVDLMRASAAALAGDLKAAIHTPVAVGQAVQPSVYIVHRTKASQGSSRVVGIF